MGGRGQGSRDARVRSPLFSDNPQGRNFHEYAQWLATQRTDDRYLPRRRLSERRPNLVQHRKKVPDVVPHYPHRDQSNVECVRRLLITHPTIHREEHVELALRRREQPPVC